MSKSIEVARRRPRIPIPLTEVDDEGADPVAEPQPADAGVPSATEMLTYAEASQYLNVPVGTIYDWVHRKVVPHVRLGPRLVRFPRRALLQWLEARSVSESGRVTP